MPSPAPKPTTSKAKATPDRVQFPLRLPTDQYNAMKAYAFFSNTSLNEVITRAVTDFLSGAARQQHLEAVVQAGQDQYRTALDKLKDL